jgi:hypothetical protein
MVFVSFPHMKIGLVCITIIFILLTCGCSEYIQKQEDTTGVPGTPELSPTTPEVPHTVEISPTIGEETEKGPIQFFPGGEYHVGDKIVISGTTNLHPGNELLVEITSISFYPTNKSEDARFYGVSDVVTVAKGPDDRNNTWSYTLDTTNLTPDSYNVLVSGITTVTFKKSATFDLLP